MLRNNNKQYTQTKMNEKSIQTNEINTIEKRDMKQVL